MKFKGYFDEAGQNGYGLIETNNYKYIGFIENRRAAGTGISIYSNHEVYIGEWKNGFREGHGCYFHSCGQKYTGMFSKGKKTGRCVVNYTNGDRYEGELKDNLKDGFGRYFVRNDENPREGTWRAGRMIWKTEETAIDQVGLSRVVKY